MRHRSNRLRLNQKPAHGQLMQRNLVTSLLLYESIRTTRKRALVIKPLVDRLITTAKTKTPHVAIRSINAVVTDKNASRKLMEVLAKRYASRPSGFTRVKAAGARKGDGAALVDLTLVDAELSAAAPVKAEKQPKKKSTQSKNDEVKESSSSSSSSSQ